METKTDAQTDARSISFADNAMPKYNFNLRTKKGSKPDEPAVVRFIIRWNGNTLTYPTHESIEPRYWGSKPGRNYQRAISTKSFPEHIEFNGKLDRLELAAKDTFRRFNAENGRDPDIGEYRKALDLALGRAEVRRLDLLQFIHDFINSDAGKFNNERKMALHRATVNKYRVTLKLLEEYHTSKSKQSGSLPFGTVDPDFIAGFISYLTEKNYAANTIVRYMRTLRMLLRRAKDSGHPIMDQVFSRRLSMSEQASDEIYLTQEELDAMYRIDFSKHPALDRARDLFIVGAWTGLRFGDLSRLRPEHIVGDHIRIPTSKTGKEVTIPLHPHVAGILNKYDNQLPRISNQKQNEHLKKVASQLPALQVKVMIGTTVGGIRREVAKAKWELVTTHTARRSFASNLYLHGINSRTIMTITGHTTEQSFMRYIRLSNDEHMKIIRMTPLFQGRLSVA